MTENTSAHDRTVVLHVADKPEDVARAVDAAASLTQARPGLRVRIIVNGPALGGVVAESQRLAPNPATTVEACEIGMRRRDLTPDLLQPAVHTVASAVIALVDAQLAGAAYVRI